jgi:hypothetical protein
MAGETRRGAIVIHPSQHETALSLLFRTDAVRACLRMGPATRFPALDLPAASDLASRVKEVAVKLWPWSILER